VILRVLIFVVRVVGLYLVARMVLRAFAGLTRGTASRPSGPAPRPKPAADLVRDRICNTFLPRDRALRAVVAGREESFCSAACRDKALAAAAQAS
jgi:hypothetical protein